MGDGVGLGTVRDGKPVAYFDFVIPGEARVPHYGARYMDAAAWYTAEYLATVAGKSGKVVYTDGLDQMVGWGNRVVVAEPTDDVIRDAADLFAGPRWAEVVLLSSREPSRVVSPKVRIVHSDSVVYDLLNQENWGGGRSVFNSTWAVILTAFHANIDMDNLQLEAGYFFTLGFKNMNDTQRRDLIFGMMREGVPRESFSVPFSAATGKAADTAIALGKGVYTNNIHYFASHFFGEMKKAPRQNVEIYTRGPDAKPVNFTAIVIEDPVFLKEAQAEAMIHYNDWQWKTYYPDPTHIVAVKTKYSHEGGGYAYAIMTTEAGRKLLKEHFGTDNASDVLARFAFYDNSFSLRGAVIGYIPPGGAVTDFPVYWARDDVDTGFVF